MVNYLVRDCSMCNSARDTLKRLDSTLAKYGKNQYFNDSYLTRKSFPKDKIKLLQYYRDILVNITWNDAFYSPHFNAQTIISRVKVLTNGL